MWNHDHPTGVPDAEGGQLRIIHRVESVDSDLFTFTETTSELGGPALRTDRATLDRFFGRLGAPFRWFPAHSTFGSIDPSGNRRNGHGTLD
ncbi:hypothetical protein M1D88_00280 [Arthrobacter sp. R1-13]